jgi:alkylhydroperoxidase/carboxymuconolactone decarboxylase family protein YurZ
MPQLPNAPKIYDDFIRRFPKVAQGWAALTAAGEDGPLDGLTERLVKLAIAIGGMREGATRSSVRKAFAAGATPEQIDQVIALAASTIGLPATVAVYSWVRDLYPRE